MSPPTVGPQRRATRLMTATSTGVIVSLRRNSIARPNRRRSIAQRFRTGGRNRSGHLVEGKLASALPAGMPPGRAERAAWQAVGAPASYRDASALFAMHGRLGLKKVARGLLAGPC